MKKRNMIYILIAMSLVLILILSGCQVRKTGGAPTVPTTVAPVSKTTTAPVTGPATGPATAATASPSSAGTATTGTTTSTSRMVSTQMSTGYQAIKGASLMSFAHIDPGQDEQIVEPGAGCDNTDLRDCPCPANELDGDCNCNCYGQDPINNQQEVEETQWAMTYEGNFVMPLEDGRYPPIIPEPACPFVIRPPNACQFGLKRSSRHPCLLECAASNSGICIEKSNSIIFTCPENGIPGFIDPVTCFPNCDPSIPRPIEAAPLNRSNCYYLTYMRECTYHPNGKKLRLYVDPKTCQFPVCPEYPPQKPPVLRCPMSMGPCGGNRYAPTDPENYCMPKCHDPNVCPTYVVRAPSSAAGIEDMLHHIDEIQRNAEGCFNIRFGSIN